MHTEDSRFIGPQSGAIHQAVTFILSRPHGEYSQHAVGEIIVPAYFVQATAVGIDPILAIAQMIHETGNMTSFWSQRPQRNPAGIGVTGRKQATQPSDPTNWRFNTQRNQWEYGLSFATWDQDAIPAHLGRLLAYALRPGESTAAQEALVARALSYRPFPANFRGSAQTLKQLGKVHNPLGAQGAGWASPGDRYGAAIAKTANAIIAVR